MGELGDGGLSRQQRLSLLISCSFALIADDLSQAFENSCTAFENSRIRHEASGREMNPPAETTVRIPRASVGGMSTMNPD
jgi:hypothetical protein